MDLKEKDTYIAEHLMVLEKDTLRFMVADLTFDNARLTAAKADLSKEVERLKVDCECHRIQAVDRGNSYQKVAAANAKMRGVLERIAAFNGVDSHGHVAIARQALKEAE